MADFPPEQLEACLLQLMAPDTNLIKQAETTLKAYLKHKDSIAGFLTQIQHSQHAQVRQMAAILVRKKINTYWMKLDPKVRDQFKAALLSQLLVETERLVTTSIALVIAAVAKHQLAIGEWPELLQFINQCSVSTEERHRELAMNLFYCLTETVGENLGAHFQEIKNMFLSALTDAQSLRVRIMAMKAACSLLSYLSSGDEVIQFQELVPVMIEVLKVLVQNGEDTEVTQFMDFFGDLAESPLPVVIPSLVPLMHFLLSTLMNENLELTTRDATTLVINKLLELKPKTVGKKNLVGDILSVCIQLIAKDDSSAGGMLSSHFEEDEDDDDDDTTPTKMAQHMLDIMALSMPSKYLDASVLKMSAECMQSADPAMRKAGTVTLGVIAEGCADRLRPRIAEILPFLYRSAEDSSHFLREAACFALGQWSEHLQPEILDHYETLLPVIFKLLDDASPSVKGTSCYVLESLTENMEPETVLPYLDPLMTKLVQLVQTSKPQIQLMAISAIGSISVGAESSFVPYFLPTANLLKPFLQLTDEKYYSLRGRALECMGYLAIAVGKEVFQPCFHETMHHAFAAAALEDMELCDYVFAFFCNVSKIFGEEFAPFLEQAIPLIIAAIKMEDGMTVKSRGVDHGQSQMASFDDSDDEEESFSEGRGTVVSVRTAMLDMKAGAVSAIESLAEHSGGMFEPYIPICMQVLATMTTYFHESVRSSVIGSLCQMVLASAEARPMPQPWVKGQPGAVPVDPMTKEILDAVMTTCIECLNDDEPVVVEKALEGIVKMTEKLGPIVAAEHMESIMTCVLEILNGEHITQVNEGDEEEEYEDESVSLLASATNVITVQAKAYGEGLDGYLKTLLPAMMKYTKGIRFADDRSTVIGCIAEVCQEIGSISAQYVNDFVPMALNGLTDVDHNVRQNSAFCIGIFAEVCGPSLNQHYPNLLQGLRPLFEVKDGAEGVADNAAAAVARMISANPAGVPLPQVLPVFLNGLPLHIDQSESVTVFHCLMNLLKQQVPDIMQHLKQVTVIFSKAVSPESDVSEELQAQIVECLRWLVSSFPEQMQTIFGSLTEQERNPLVARLN